MPHFNRDTGKLGHYQFFGWIYHARFCGLDLNRVFSDKSHAA